MKLRQALGLLLIVLALALSACGASLPAGCPPDCVGKNLNNRNLAHANLSGAQLMDADLSQVVMIGTR